MSTYISERLRNQIAETDRRRCCYCLTSEANSGIPMTHAHVIPRSKGGTDEDDNLALACQGCNNRKYNHVEARDPVSGNLVPLYHPRHQRWADHFGWNEDFTLAIGLTPTGRATVERLQLNREGVVNWRRVLRTIGQHPPMDSEQV